MKIADDLACQELVELVTEYLEGTLPSEVSERVEQHLEICPGCELYLGQMRLTVRALRGLRRTAGSVPAATREALLLRFRQSKG